MTDQIDVFDALSKQLGVDRREAKRLIYNATLSEDARYKRGDTPAGADLFSITMSNDQLQAAIGVDAVIAIEEAGFVLVPKTWRDLAMKRAEPQDKQS